MMTTETETITDQLNREFACDHDGHRRLAFVVRADGERMYCRQCHRCGAATNWIGRGTLSVADKAAAVAKDDAIARAWQQRRSERYQQLRDEAEAARRDEWNDWYQDYLRSSGWHRRRELVLRRAGGICEGCLTRPASQVHHLTYDHVGDELLFELRAVCRECHEKIHTDKVDVRRN